MISGFQSLSTINSGLILQELQQDINASNLAQPSLDAQGYLMNSLETINSGTSPGISFNGANGVMTMGTGVTADSITRLRDSFLDNQIRLASTAVGYNEILANTAGTGVLNQVNSIINSSSTSTLNYALTQFQSAWQTLGANAVPANDTTDRAAVVSAGTSFAQMANSQYNQLQSLQVGYNNKIQSSVTQINQLLQQLNSINGELNTSQGSNPNGLLDARDYALDKLSRLMNFQVTFGNNGTASVFLNGISLVSSGGAGQLETDLSDPNNPALADITLVPPASPNSMQEGGDSTSVPPTPSSTVDLTYLITGGNLGGELYARNVILESYKQQVNQAATAVMNIANTFQSAGFGSDGRTTGTLFFEGTGASNIVVNGVLGSNPGLVAESSVAFNNGSPGFPYAGAPATGNQQIAQMLGGGTYPTAGGPGSVTYPGLMSLLAQNFAASDASVDVANPYAALNTVVPGGVGATGSFSINGVTITYNGTTDSISSVVNMINSDVSGVSAVYNAASEQFFIFSTGPVNISDVSGNPPFANNSATNGWTNIDNFMVGTSTLNNSFVPTQPDVYTGSGIPQSPLNSYIPIVPPPAPPPGPNFGPNISAYLVSASSLGTFSVNGTQIQWNDSMALNDIENLISVPATGVTSAQAQTNINHLLPTFFGGNQAQVYEMESLQPIEMYDVSGNFTSVVGMNNPSDSLGELSSSMLGQINNDLSNQQLLTSQEQDSLNQLNTAQANIAGINTGSSSSSSSTGIPTSSTSGVPIASIQQQATQAAATYNALVEVMQVIDNMYADLINVVGGTNTSTSSSTFVS